MRGALRAQPFTLRRRRTLTADRNVILSSPFAPHPPVGHPLPVLQGEGNAHDSVRHPQHPIIHRVVPQVGISFFARGLSFSLRSGEKVPEGRMRGALSAEPFTLRRRRTLTADRNVILSSPFAPQPPVGHPLPALQGEGNAHDGVRHPQHPIIHRVVPQVGISFFARGLSFSLRSGEKESDGCHRTSAPPRCPTKWHRPAALPTLPG